jgi:hypothetical protein
VSVVFGLVAPGDTCGGQETKFSKCRHMGYKQREKEGVVSESVYIRVVPVSPAPLIFVGDATSPTNISHVYLSVAWPHRRTYEDGQCQPGCPMCSSVSSTYRQT